MKLGRSSLLLLGHFADLQRIEHQFIYITPAPLFARLKRLDDWMGSLTKMLRSMTVRRGIAAPNMTACHAESQVDPLTTDAQTVLTAARARYHVPYLIKMCAFHGHLASLAI